VAGGQPLRHKLTSSHRLTKNRFSASLGLRAVYRSIDLMMLSGEARSSTDERMQALDRLSLFS
jgi:hypothetical protein